MTETSKEYASALFMLAEEENLQKEIAENLGAVSNVMKGTPEYLDFLSSPNIPMSERIAAIDKAFEGNVHEYTASFIKLLCERGHIRLLHKCISEYNDLYHAADGISTARVICAVPLTKAEKEALKAKLEAQCGHTVIVDYSVNKAIMGGIIVHLDGKVYDGSVRRRLHEIKEVMHL